MTPLDDFTRWRGLLDGSARRFLSPTELSAFEAIPPADREAQLKALLEAPIARFTPVNDAWFRARWAETLRLVHPGPALLEVATGEADMIPQAMARAGLGGRYVTANMNREANRGLRERTAGLGLRVEIVEDDAANILRHAGPDAFDVIAFQHGLNDVIQAILCAREGVDTAGGDWMELLPGMIAMVRRELDGGTLEEHAMPGLLALMRALAVVLKPGGLIIINHYQFQLDLDWGYPPELWEGLVPLARGWLRGLPGFTEASLPGHHPDWWLFLRKDERGPA
jgi:hypothetical protein